MTESKSGSPSRIAAVIIPGTDRAIALKIPTNDGTGHETNSYQDDKGHDINGGNFANPSSTTTYASTVQHQSATIEELRQEIQVLKSEQIKTSSLQAPSFVALHDLENRRIDIFDRNTPSVVEIGTDSGFVWNNEGYIVTNYHVVKHVILQFYEVTLITPNNLVLSSNDSPAVQTSNIKIVSSNEYKRTVFKAILISIDPEKDIIVLEIEAPKDILHPVQVGTSFGLKVGQHCLAIGNPFGRIRSLVDLEEK